MKDPCDARNFMPTSAVPRCLVTLDTEGGRDEKAVEAHCLITEDTVADDATTDERRP